MKRYGQISGKNISYIEDIRANAKGSEYLGRMKVSGDRHKEETRLNFVVPALCILPVAAVDSHVDLNIIGGAIVAVHTFFTPYTL